MSILSRLVLNSFHPSISIPVTYLTLPTITIESVLKVCSSYINYNNEKFTVLDDSHEVYNRPFSNCDGHYIV